VTAGAFAALPFRGCWQRLAPLALVLVDARRVGAAWDLAVVTKALLLAVALAIFSYISWWNWPRRVFATEAELPALRRTLRRSAYALTGCVAAAMVLGFALGANSGP
jgi:hypothetical protein